MAPLPSRKALESLKRAELQNLCKEYGVRANLKSEALIDLLLQTQSAPPPSPSPMRRSMSTTRPTSRAGPSRAASMIIHDIEGNEEQDAETITEDPEPQIEERSQSLPAPPIRTRKAKETQTRLGVGRPKAAGGSGPRAVTKSTSVPRGRRGKLSRTMSRVDETIPEEVEPSSAGPSRAQLDQEGNDNLNPEPAFQSVPPQEQPGNGSRSTCPDTHLLSSSNDISHQIAVAIRPLQVKVESLEEELRNTQKHNQELQQIQLQLSNLATLQQRYDELEAEVRELRTESVTVATLAEEFKQLKANLSARPSPQPALPSTPKAKTPRLPPGGGLGLGFPSMFKGMGYPPMMETTPTDAPPVGPSSTMLGKRPRSSSPSNASGILEKGQVDVLSDEEAARAVLRPDKKRAKLDGRASSSSPNKPTTLEVAAQLLAPRIPSFTIFQGPESDFSTPYPRGDPPPPTNLLPEVYRPPSPSGAPLLPPARAGSGSRTTSSAASSENQRRHFDFSLFPAVNEHETFIPPIPFPEAPQSPTPASSNLGHQHHIQDDGRTDPFKEYGFPSPRRPRIASGSRASGTQREVSSNDIAAGLGLTMVRTGTPDYPEAPPGGKTLYGTEMEGETRFGDFGGDGIGSGFWSTR